MRWLFVVCVGLIGATSVGCGDACTELSHKICRCKPTDSEQQACTQRVDNDAGQTPVEDEAALKACEGFLDTCTCDKLADGDLEACGLARESTE